MELINPISYDTTKGVTNQILFELEKTGFALLRKFPILDTVKQDFLILNEKIGVPISHDNKNTLVWDIKKNDNSKSNIITFSEHNHEATLHTDSQYSENPEDFFSLLCLKKASCGGGISYILKLADLVSDLKKTENGLRCMRILKNSKFPFIVPSVFSKTQNVNHEFNFGLVLLPNEIRYREDILEKALELNPSYKTSDNVFALNYLKNTINDSNKILSFYLEFGDIIFVNNKTTLHGRSSFSDPKRHLLRVRLNRR